MRMFPSGTDTHALQLPSICPVPCLMLVSLPLLYRSVTDTDSDSDSEDDIPAEEKLSQAAVLKGEGNDLFRAKENAAAAEKYRQALKLVEHLAVGDRRNRCH